MSYRLGSFFLTKRFFPLFITQCAGAFNDNLMKTALGILVIYHPMFLGLGSEKLSEVESMRYLVLASAMFILPFLLFSALAGQVADKYEKSKIVVITRIVELIIMFATAGAFYFNSVEILFFLLFLMGLHSTFFGPLKYSILPDHLNEDELVGGNALIECGTFISILLGTVWAGATFSFNNPIVIVSISLMLVSLTGFIASIKIPFVGRAEPELKINYNFISSTYEAIKYPIINKQFFYSIIGISWFWVMGALFVTFFPTFSRGVLGANEEVVTFFHGMFSVGIGIGSLLCNKALHGDVSARYIPLGAIGLTVFTLDIAYLGIVLNPSFFPLIHDKSGVTIPWGLDIFFLEPVCWRLIFDVLALSISGGFFVVPLYALIQKRAEATHRARVVASNNVVNAFAMVICSVFIVLLTFLGLGTGEVFLIFGIISLFVALATFSCISPESYAKFFKKVFSFIFRVDIKGYENINNAGDKVVVVANYSSYLDIILLNLYLKKSLLFIVKSSTLDKWYFKILNKFVKFFPIDHNNPLSIKQIIRKIDENQWCVIFPEGRVTVTGTLMKIYEGSAMVIQQGNAKILPVCIRGAERSFFSGIKGKVKLRLFPKIFIQIHPTVSLNRNWEVVPRCRRESAAQQLYEIMTCMLVESAKSELTLYSRLIKAATINGWFKTIVEDSSRKTLTYFQILYRSRIVAKAIEKSVKDVSCVGLIIPNSNANLISFFAISFLGLTPAMLNFCAGSTQLVAACKAGRITKILTSKKFFFSEHTASYRDKLLRSYEILFLEDLLEKLSLLNKISTTFLFFFCKYEHNKRTDGLNYNDPAVLLFTSGSEGEPKGVALSHRAIQTNISQLSAKVDFNSADIVFNALPMFHSFGLTVGTLLPLMSGMRFILYPSPLHFRQIAELIYETDATILFGTDTFLRGYGKVAHVYDFYRIRLVFAGAEKLTNDTKQLWLDRFGIRIFEGYGTTETAPVLAMNTSMHYRQGSVGKLLPLIEYRLRTIEGVHKGGVLQVKAPNVMNGYVTTEMPGVIVPLEDGWYDTGDVVEIDEDGYIYIVGRIKRFAKIAGEMVSLTTIERILDVAVPESRHAVISVSESGRGEKIVLITEAPELTRSIVRNFITSNGYSELWCPRNIVSMDSLPVLPTGKIDYGKLEHEHGNIIYKDVVMK
jgi:acyl-[acyl-carrier-protein]-phospholipid O-acyltransferase / long-chain-fatty-acid--[acyl-carrier-protein] ligase